MIELVQGESGVRMADPDYVRGLRRVCDEHGVLLIFDEVQTGIGRTGRLFGYENFGVTPDLIGLAKGLGGGLPIGAVLSSEAVSVLAPGEHGSTFGGSPVSCAAARVVLDRVMAPGFLDEVRAKGEHARTRLRDSAAQGARITDVRGLGLMIGFDLESEDAATEVVEQARANGLLIIKAGPVTIRIVPPLNITQDELDEGLDALEAARGV
jgi:acetylornithine/N-succinyldiaminopimelate aminotransferase